MTRITIVQGDITVQAVDAIVNAAKPSLLGGSGVDGAVHKAAGPGLLEACRALPTIPPESVGGPTRWIAGTTQGIRCRVGEARVTPGFDLPARYVIHTVGPLFDPMLQPECEDDLGGAYLGSIVVAEALGCRTIAFPAISTGVYQYPLEDAARIAVTIAGRPHWILDEIRFVLFTDNAHAAFETALLNHFGQHA